MINSDSPTVILEIGSAHINLAVYNQIILNQNKYYEEKIKYTKGQTYKDYELIFKLINRAEKDIGTYFNEIVLMLDASSIYSLDYTIQKNFDKKIINNQDIDYLVKEVENIIRMNNRDKDILHIIKSNLYFDDSIIENFDNISSEVHKVTLELKFIMIEKKICDYFKNMFIEKHISLNNVICSSYIKSLGLINKLEINGYSSFIDIGLKKSCLTIYKDNKLLYLNNTHIGGDHITKDISKVLKIDYRKSEAKKIKFSKKNEFNSEISKNSLLKNIINARLEEIIELLFLNCPILKNKNSVSSLKLFFTGNGARVLNENLLTFGNEFNFVSEMSIIDELQKDNCDSALKFISSSQKLENVKTPVNFENKGFFERLFDYFSSK